MTARLLQEMTREAARALAGEALLVLPVGSTEQHGPHLPAGTDFMVAEHVAREAAARAAEQIPVVVAPTLPFGSSHHHLPFGATISLSTDVYYRVLLEIGHSLVTSGFRYLFIVNGHGGNHEVVQLVARDLALQHPVYAAAGSYWVMAWDALVGEEAHLTGNFPGHAGAFETSLIMALRPDLVAERLPHRDGVPVGAARTFESPYRKELHGSWQAIDGYSGSPDRADAERGRAYLATVIRATADAFVDFYSAARR
jgi:creatinine amidohydrolase